MTNAREGERPAPDPLEPQGYFEGRDWHPPDWEARAKAAAADVAGLREQLQQAEQTSMAKEILDTQMRCKTCGTAAFQPRTDGRCTSHISWADALKTEQEMHAAWEKRAYEAEAEGAGLRARLQALYDDLSGSPFHRSGSGEAAYWCGRLATLLQREG